MMIGMVTIDTSVNFQPIANPSTRPPRTVATALKTVPRKTPLSPDSTLTSEVTKLVRIPEEFRESSKNTTS
jgi:hypothetical protein